MNISDSKRCENGGFQIDMIKYVPDIGKMQQTEPFSVFIGLNAENRELLSRLTEWRCSIFINIEKNSIQTILWSCANK